MQDTPSPPPSTFDVPLSTEGPASAELVGALDHMFEGLQVIDRDWRYLYVNDTAAQHGMRTKAELLGRTMMECYPEIEQTAMFRQLEQAMAGRAQRLENLFAYPDGSNRWFELRVQPVPQGVVVLSIDISERKAREEELHRRREELATILACIANAVVTLDEDGRVVSLNPSGESILGCAQDEAAGRRLTEVVDLSDLHGGEPVAVGLGTGQADGLVLSLRRRDGSELQVVASEATLADSQGRSYGVVVALGDVSQAHELEKQLRHSQKMEAIGRLASGVAHDFNNLLTVIMSFGSFVGAELPEGSQARDDLAEIMSAAKRAEGLTRQLLAFSRRRPVRPAIVDVNELIEGLDRMIRRLLSAEINVAGSACDRPWPVHIDPGGFEQVMVNLVVNARDAMPAGGKLTIETFNQRISSPHASARGEVVPAGDYVMVTVSDDGAGIPREIAEQIFEPFFTTKEAGKGTGLGLSTCYGIVRQAGGYLSVYSEPGVGSTFRMYLPRAEAPRSSSVPPDPEPPRRVVGRGTILVAEDDDQVRRLVVRALEREGYQVLAASGAEQAAQLCDDHAGALDLLITDVVMPGGSGGELADHVRDRRGPTRTLFMSGYTAGAISSHGVLPQDVELLPKPFGPKDLIERVRQLMSGSAAVGP